MPYDNPAMREYQTCSSIGSSVLKGRDWDQAMEDRGGQERTGERTCHSKEDEDEDEKNRVIWRQGMGCLNNKATNMHSLNTV